MNSLTTQSVVDRMTADLAVRRRETIHRAAAYLTFARAILNDEQSELPTQLYPITQTAAAA